MTSGWTAALTFVSGFTIETACVYWVHFSERNQALPTALCSMAIGSAQVLGIGESIHDWRSWRAVCAGLWRRHVCSGAAQSQEEARSMKKTLMLVTEAERKLIEDNRSADHYLDEVRGESKQAQAEIRAAIVATEYRYRCKHCGLGTNCSDLICVGCFAY